MKKQIGENATSNNINEETIYDNELWGLKLDSSKRKLLVFMEGLVYNGTFRNCVLDTLSVQIENIEFNLSITFADVAFIGDAPSPYLDYDSNLHYPTSNALAEEALAFLCKFAFITYSIPEIFVSMEMARKYMFFFQDLDTSVVRNYLRIDLTTDNSIRIIDDICNGLDFILISNQGDTQKIFYKPTELFIPIKEFMSLEGFHFSSCYFDQKIYDIDEYIEKYMIPYQDSITFSEVEDDSFRSMPYEIDNENDFWDTPFGEDD